MGGSVPKFRFTSSANSSPQTAGGRKVIRQLVNSSRMAAVVGAIAWPMALNAWNTAATHIRRFGGYTSSSSANADGSTRAAPVD